MNEKTRRNEEIFELRKKGLTFERVGQMFNISKQRVAEIYKIISTRKNVKTLLN